jgi:DHA2 family multidrug resistance protein
MTHAFSELGQSAEAAALKTLSGIVSREAFLLSFSDVFLILTGMFVALVAALYFVERPKPVPAGGGGGH